jgi:hypothetical protein
MFNILCLSRPLGVERDNGGFKACSSARRSTVRRHLKHVDGLAGGHEEGITLARGPQSRGGLVTTFAGMQRLAFCWARDAGCECCGTDQTRRTGEQAAA